MGLLPLRSAFAYCKLRSHGAQRPASTIPSPSEKSPPSNTASRTGVSSDVGGPRTAVRTEMVGACRTPDASAMSGPSYDVIVIGGGITGAGVLRHCALRGLKAILVEKGELGRATT